MSPSSGGLVTAISGIKSGAETVWVGAAPDSMEPEHWKQVSPEEDNAKKYKPVFIDKERYDLYYNGMCNDVLWPLLHYESGMVEFREEYWDAYIKVNEQFAEAILEIAEEDDLIWVHDFHFFLLPQLLKVKRPSLKIGLFLHIPFPSSEIFKQLPVRREILNGILASDLVGFHDYSYLRHFGASVYSVLGIDSSLLSVQNGSSTTQLGVFPVSIDVADFKRQAVLPEVRTIARQMSKRQPYQQLILGVDRLDYIKGIELKLRAFEQMLHRNPDFVGKVGLLQLAVPSRTEIPGYIQLKYEIEQLVGEINGNFGQPHYVPIQYMFASVSFHELLALYRLADVLLVTSKRDGMNLVALEYLVAQQQRNPGVVVLSEFAGAISTLSHVISTNPWDINGTADNLTQALTLTKEERTERHQPMLRYLESYTATDWAESFMKSLDELHLVQPDDKAISLSLEEKSSSVVDGLVEQIASRDLIIFLDYDGTTVPICERPDQAILPDDLKMQLKELSELPHVELVIVSGRDARFLQAQLEGLNVAVGAEHGAQFFNPKDKRWKRLTHGDRKTWFKIARRIMSDYAVRVPESFIEKKQFGLSWHYRRSPSEFARYQARKLTINLKNALVNLPVSVIEGRKVVEVRAAGANKGVFARWYLDNFRKNLDSIVIGIGDDETDEDLFESIPHSGGITIKVGKMPTRATYRLSNQADVLALLDKFVSSKRQLELPGFAGKISELASRGKTH